MDERALMPATSLEDTYTSSVLIQKITAVIAAFSFALREEPSCLPSSSRHNEEAVEIAEPVYGLMLGATTRLREIDGYSDTVADLMEVRGFLKAPSWSVLSRQLGAIASVALRKKAVRRGLRCALDELFEPAWSDAVLKMASRLKNVSNRFDYMLETIDTRLFGSG